MKATILVLLVFIYATLFDNESNTAPDHYLQKLQHGHQFSINANDIWTTKKTHYSS